MAKTAVIMSIGSFYCPWFPYTLASTYTIGDFIVVVNAGFDLKNPNMKEYEVPLKEVSRDIDELDVEGKIIEVSEFSRLRHKLPIVTQKLANQLKLREWYDHRGRGITLASDIAYDEGARMILRTDTDTVCYEDALGVRKRDYPLIFYQYEFRGDIYHLADPGPDSPYNDSVNYYPNHKDDWFVGAGAPVIHCAPRVNCPDFHCAHLRYANPIELSEEEKYDHFRNRAIVSLWTNVYGVFTEELFEKARETALDALKSTPTGTGALWTLTHGHRLPLDWNAKPSNVPPPEVCLISRKNLREYIEEKQLCRSV